MSSAPFLFRRSVNMFPTALGAVALVALLGACGKTEPVATPQPTPMPMVAPPAPATGTTVGTDLDDSVVTTRVKAAFAMDDVVKGMDVSVETRKGEVVLSGFVDTSQQKELAGELARGTEGVSQVRNDLLVRQ